MLQVRPQQSLVVCGDAAVTYFSGDKFLHPEIIKATAKIYGEAPNVMFQWFSWVLHSLCCCLQCFCSVGEYAKSDQVQRVQGFQKTWEVVQNGSCYYLIITSEQKHFYMYSKIG